MSRAPAWTPAENAAVIALYFEMLDKAMTGQPYNKAQMLRVAKEGISEKDITGPFDYSTPYVGLLGIRTKGSIEAKLMNCTAVHRDLTPDATTMDGYGYRALSNYQAALKEAMAAHMLGISAGLVEHRERSA